jgi:hypothetical protein
MIKCLKQVTMSNHEFVVYHDLNHTLIITNVIAFIRIKKESDCINTYNLLLKRFYKIHFFKFKIYISSYDIRF